MKKTLKKVLICAVFVLLISALFAVTSFAAESDIFSSLSVKVTEKDDNAFVKTQLSTDSERYFFLPSSTDFTNLTLCFDDASSVVLSTELGSVTVVSGQSFDLTALFREAASPEDVTGEDVVAPVDASEVLNEYTVNITVDGETSELNFMKSENLRAMFFVSEDPALHGLAWIDASESNAPPRI